MPDLNELRADVVALITDHYTPEGQAAPALRWRVIITDSESPTGIALVCPSATDPAGLHVIADYPGGPIQAEDGVYDCCPWPQVETHFVALAAYLVALLNADAERTGSAGA